MQESSRQDWVRTLRVRLTALFSGSVTNSGAGTLFALFLPRVGFCCLFLFWRNVGRLPFTSLHGGGGEREELTTQWLTLAEALKCPVPAPDRSWEKCPLPAPRYTTTFAAAEPTLDLVQGFSGPSHLHASDWLGTFFHFRLFF